MFVAFVPVISSIASMSLRRTAGSSITRFAPVMYDDASEQSRLVDLFAQRDEPADGRCHGAHVPDGLDDVPGPGFAFAADHREQAALVAGASYLTCNERHHELMLIHDPVRRGYDHIVVWGDRAVQVVQRGQGPLDGAGEDSGEIEIDIGQAGGQLVMELKNPFPGGGRHSAGNRMAIVNIRERLQLHFDAEASLASKANRDSYEVHIRMPYRTYVESGDAHD